MITPAFARRIRTLACALRLATQGGDSQTRVLWLVHLFRCWLWATRAVEERRVSGACVAAFTQRDLRADSYGSRVVGGPLRRRGSARWTVRRKGQREIEHPVFPSSEVSLARGCYDFWRRNRKTSKMPLRSAVKGRADTACADLDVRVCHFSSTVARHGEQLNCNRAEPMPELAR
jgi:hypothetical protein